MAIRDDTEGSEIVKCVDGEPQSYVWLNEKKALNPEVSEIETKICEAAANSESPLIWFPKEPPLPPIPTESPGEENPSNSFGVSPEYVDWKLRREDEGNIKYVDGKLATCSWFEGMCEAATITLNESFKWITEALNEDLF
jgi:hypothetical protein